MNGKTKLDRRRLLTGAAAVGVAAAATASEQVTAATPAVTPVAVSKRGVYDMVPLRQETINVAAIQSRLLSIDLRDKAKTLKRNLDRVLRLIDLAQNSPEEWNYERRWGSKVDLICMHEFPVQGF